MENIHQDILFQIEEIKKQLNSPNQEIKDILINIEKQQQQIFNLLQPTSEDNNNNFDLLLEDQFLNKQKSISPDYSVLENLLKYQQWRQADQETVNLILSLVHKTDKGYLTVLDLHQLSCVDLRIIDQLWQDYSNNKFGITIQKNIYQSLGGTRFFHQELWQKFGQQIGWYKNNNWLKYEELNFTDLDNAPLGHLPILGDGQIWFVGGWEGSFKAFSLFLEKLTTCHL
jgi:hypothetical protein